MKRIIVLIGFIAFMAVSFTANSQSVTNTLKTISTSQVAVYSKPTDLNLNEYVISTYYVQDFAKNARFTIQVDTFTTLRRPHVRGVLMRSPNNVDWYSNVGDTVSVTATLGSGHKVGKSALITNIYEPYLKITTTAIDSTQNTKLKTFLLIEKN
jgi:hypothetical protein